MTVIPEQRLPIVPTQAEAKSRWVALDMQPRRVEACSCDPARLYQCPRCFIADDVLFERSQDI